LDKDGEGMVTIVPEEAEDMFCVYNLLQQGDSLKSSTIRKVQKESSTGSSTSEKLKITLTVTVEAVQFDPDSGMLRVKGRNITENEFVKMNAYHTIDLEPNRKFTLKKACWDVVAMEMLDEACDPKNKADIGAVVMAEVLSPRALGLLASRPLRGSSIPACHVSTLPQVCCAACRGLRTSF
jgi:protein pelota